MLGQCGLVQVRNRFFCSEFTTPPWLWYYHASLTRFTALLMLLRTQVLPVSMQTLRNLNQSLVERSKNKKLHCCSHCDAPYAAGSCRCKTRYCSVVRSIIPSQRVLTIAECSCQGCQKAQWSLHKHHCKAVGALHRWNRIDWG